MFGLLLFLGLAVVAAPAVAQEMPTVLPHDYVLSDILNQQRIEAAIGTPAARTSGRPAGHTATRAMSAAVTRYRPSAEVSQRVRKQFVGWMGRTVGAVNAGRLAAALERGDPVQSWSSIVAGDGLRANDLADAMASYWVLNWAMANGRDNNRTQALAVREQVRAILASQASRTEIQRQEMAEIFILNFLIQHAAYMDAMQRGDRDLQRRLGDAAVARFRSEMGVDLRQLRLTDTGFVPVRAGG